MENKPKYTKDGFEITWAAAQTSLHVLLSDETPKHSGAYFSQSSVLYQNKEYKDGGWPLKSPNPHAHDIQLAKKLVEKSCHLVGLRAWSQ